MPEQTQVETKAEPDYTSVALGIFRGNKGWQACKIRYNGITGEVGKLEPVGEGGDKLSAIERFKILAVQEKVVA